MKLLYQVFSLYPPARWSEHLPVHMPSYWAEAAQDINHSDIEFINWNSGFVMVAKYAAEDDEEPFVVYREGVQPDSMRLTFKEDAPYTSKKIYSDQYSELSIKHTCKCCVTLFYPKAK